jgi:hypothetical protein
VENWEGQPYCPVPAYTVWPSATKVMSLPPPNSFRPLWRCHAYSVASVARQILPASMPCTNPTGGCTYGLKSTLRDTMPEYPVPRQMVPVASLLLGRKAVRSVHDAPPSTLRHSVTQVACRMTDAFSGCTVAKDDCSPSPYACADGGAPLAVQLPPPSCVTKMCDCSL